MVSKTTIASCMLAHSGLGILMRRTARTRGFIVLNYHRLGYPSSTTMDRLVFSATQEMFARQLKFLKTECDLITPSQIQELPRRPRGIYAMITFDDGYRDNLLNAAPILHALGLPATVFVVAGRVGGALDHDDAHDPANALMNWHDLEKWSDMITINVYPTAHGGDALRGRAHRPQPELLRPDGGLRRVSACAGSSDASGRTPVSSQLSIAARTDMY